MKKLIISICLMLIAASGFAQVPTWLWAESAGGLNHDYSIETVTDKSGNIYQIGTFSSPTITFGATTLINDGGRDLFITKYDPLGNVIWARRAGGKYLDDASGIIADNYGNIYIAACTMSDSIFIGSDTLLNAGLTNFFIAKYDSSGNIKWAKQWGNKKLDMCNDIAVDSLSNIYIVGSFTSDTLILGNDTLQHCASDDIFIAKFDSLGNEIWAKSVGGNSEDNGKYICIDRNSNIFIAGDFTSDSLKFGNTIIYNTSPSNRDIFITKYNSLGNVICAKKVGGNYDEEITDLYCDKNDNVYLSGIFSSSIVTFDSITLNNNNGYYNILIAKYNNSGEIKWARKAGREYNTTYHPTLSTDMFNNVFLSCSFENNSIIIENDTLINDGISNYFIAKYDSLGNLIWNRKTGGNGAAYNSGITIDALNNIYVSGYFKSKTITIGNTILTNADTSGYFADVFIARFDATTGINESEPNSENSISLFPNPTMDEITIIIHDKATIEIMNIQGQIIKTITTVEKQTSIDVSDLSSGIYIIKAKTEKGLAVKKFIKQ